MPGEEGTEGESFTVYQLRPHGTAIMPFTPVREMYEDPAAYEADMAHVGEWTGLTRDEIEARWPGALDAWRRGDLLAPPGGERNEDFAVHRRFSRGWTAADSISRPARKLSSSRARPQSAL